MKSGEKVKDRFDRDGKEIYPEKWKGMESKRRKGTDRSKKPSEKGEKMNAKLIGIIVLLALLVTIAIQNFQPVTVRFLFWAYEMSTVLIVLLSFLIGCLVGGLVVWVGAGKKGKKREEPPLPPSKG